VDRILARGRVLTLDGPSMRTKHRGLDDPTSLGAADQPARISGIQRPEFPEPTAPVQVRFNEQLMRRNQESQRHVPEQT